jgi:3'(2'), 5'-bisphosphate nucleotidase
MYERELQAALDAAQAAGTLLVQEYVRFQAIPNAPAAITTEADRQSQEIILKHVHAVFPADALCAEEETETLVGKSATGERLWIVDPIDGTRGFARKNGEFSVMVGFVERGQIAVGVVLQPAGKRLTYAVRGSGCWRRDAGQEAVACRVSQVRALSQATLVQSRSRDPAKRTRVVEALEPGQVSETYSAGIKLALVARGEADIYPNTYDAFHDWDICAGHLLVTEAGGKVTALNGQELRYGLPGAWQRDGLLASNGCIHEEAIKRLA